MSVTRAGMQAVVMAGGEGSRLRPLTSNMPKPMLPIANRPMMEHILELLRSHGFTDVVATVQFLASVIRNYFGDGSDLGVSLSYSTEDMPLGTAGSVHNARDLLSGPLLVISGDALTDMDLRRVIDFHRSRGAAATLVLKRMQDPLEFGIVMTQEDGRIERFLEKPTWGQVFSDTVNTGIYVLEEEVLDLIPPEQSFDFSADLFPLMLDKGLPLYGFVTDAYWTDVGHIDAYLQAHRDVLEGRVSVELPYFELEPSIWVGEEVDIHPEASLRAPAVIGDNVRVGPGAGVGPLSVIGDNVLIAADCTVAGTVVMDRAHLGPMAQVRGGIVGRGSVIERGAALEEGAVCGDEAVVGAGSLVKSRVKVYPSRSVEAGAIVAHSVVRERRAGRSLFGRRGVSGLVNIGMTPQAAVSLGMAYGSTLERGSAVLAGRDASRAARTLKRAMIAGLNATGVTCRDLELMPMPVTRFATRSEQAAGGVSVRTSPSDPEVVEIRLFDSDGLDLPEASQRKIDRMYFREDFRRPGPQGLGELEFPPHIVEQYSRGLLRALDGEAIRRAGLKVVVDYAYGPASLIGPSILGRLGCDVLAVSSFTDEHRPLLRPDGLARHLERLRDHTRNSGSDLGLLLEPGGEIARLVDERGRVVADDRALLAFLQHEAQRGAGTVVVPVSSPLACERIARSNGARLQWSPTGWPALMGRAAKPEVTFAGDSGGGLIFPRFMAAPDALMTFGKALEIVAANGRPLGELVDALPRSHLVRLDVRTPWQLKGAVMRKVASASVPGRLMLLDGVKVIQGDRWALVIPLADEPACRIWAEAPTEDGAADLAARFVRMVEDIVSAEAPET